MSRLSRMQDSYLDPDQYLMGETCCEVCKRDPADCICLVCPKCTEQGNPKCEINQAGGAADGA